MAASFFPSSHPQSISRLPTTRSTAIQLQSENVNSSLLYSDDCKVFFKGLKKKTSPASVLSAFLAFGSALLIKVPFSHITQKNMGHGFVVFKDAKTARTLVESIGSLVIEGKVVILSGYDFRQKKSYKEKFTMQKESSASLDGRNNNRLCSGIPRTQQATLQACDQPEETYASQARTKTSSRESFVKPTDLHRQAKAPVETDRDSPSFFCLKPTTTSYHTQVNATDRRDSECNFRFNLSKTLQNFRKPVHFATESRQSTRSAEAPPPISRSAAANTSPVQMPSRHHKYSNL